MLLCAGWGCWLLGIAVVSKGTDSKKVGLKEGEQHDMWAGWLGLLATAEGLESSSRLCDNDRVTLGRANLPAWVVIREMGPPVLIFRVHARVIAVGCARSRAGSRRTGTSPPPRVTQLRDVSGEAVTLSFVSSAS